MSKEYAAKRQILTDQITAKTLSPTRSAAPLAVHFILPAASFAVS
jgi:hypothetical protein